jgi:hypothetical protein
VGDARLELPSGFPQGQGKVRGSSEEPVGKMLTIAGFSKTV